MKKTASILIVLAIMVMMSINAYATEDTTADATDFQATNFELPSDFVFSPQPTTTEEIQEYIDANIKPMWEFEVAQELFPEDYRCDYFENNGGVYWSWFPKPQPFAPEATLFGDENVVLIDGETIPEESVDAADLLLTTGAENEDGLVDIQITAIDGEPTVDDIAPLEVEEGVENPKTGDNTLIFWAIGALIASILGIILISAKGAKKV